MPIDRNRIPEAAILGLSLLVGQFSVENGDFSTPYVKKVRVVSRVEYYLSD